MIKTAVETPPPATQRELSRTLRILTGPTVLLGVGTGYAYFLGWVVLHSKLYTLGLLHEFQSLPISEYLSAIAFMVSMLALAVGLACLARAFTQRYWFLTLLLPLWLISIGQRELLKFGETPELAFAYPRVALAVMVLLALLILACAASMKVRTWIVGRIRWRWGRQAVPIVTALFLTFSYAVTHGMYLAQMLLNAERSVTVAVSDPIIAEHLVGRNLCPLMRIEDRWYFADRNHIQRLRRVYPIMVPADKILGTMSYLDPFLFPDFTQVLNEYETERRMKNATQTHLSAPAVPQPPVPAEKPK